jgi:hypothetical protein
VEQEATRALFQEGGKFSLGLFSFAVEFLNVHGSEDADFELTDADLTQFHDELRTERELELGLSAFLQAERIVRFEVESEIAVQGWGALGGFRRTIPYDAPLQSALELLRGADSTADLFSQAATAGIGTLGFSGGVVR